MEEEVVVGSVWEGGGGGEVEGRGEEWYFLKKKKKGMPLEFLNVRIRARDP